MKCCVLHVVSQVLVCVCIYKHIAAWLCNVLQQCTVQNSLHAELLYLTTVAAPPPAVCAAAGLDELQQHRRAHSVDEKASAAAAAAAAYAPGGHISVLPLAAQNEALLEKCLNLLLVLSACDGVVKGWMCSKDNLQQLLDLTQRLQMPGLLKVCLGFWCWWLWGSLDGVGQGWVCSSCWT
jgi:hypothetical protein